MNSTGFLKAAVLLSVFVFIQCSGLRAQSKYTISGFVKDAASGEALIGANVYIKEKLKGTSTNQYGFYSLTFEEGQYVLVVSFLGYQDYTLPVLLNKNLRINVQLLPSAIQTQEVVITGEREDKNVQSTQMGKVELEVEKIKSLPAFLGEVDILKTIQLLPGVQSAGEGNSGYYVRGGGPDQNLILLDEAVVYNASHLFGFFSVFNADAVKNVSLIKGGMPAQYGGRLASVLDISMKEGNNREFHGDGGLGFVASRLTLEGPIKKDTSSFIISARRTFVDLFLRKPFVKEGSDVEGNIYFFYDVNAKLNYRLSDKDRLYLSGYFGRDVFNFNNTESGFKVKIPWGNATGSFRWNHLFSDRMFFNASLIFSDYRFRFNATQQQFDFGLYSGIRDYNAKLDFAYFPTISHAVKFGGNYVYHIFTPSNASARSGDVVFDLGKTVKFYAHDAALYVNDDWDVTDRFALSSGLRFSMFQHVGPFERYLLDETGKNVEDTIRYERGKKVAQYFRAEPRLSMRYNINLNSSVKASFTQNYQYIHLAAIGSVSLPTDVWVPSTDKVKPQRGEQYALGYFRNFKKNLYETSLEIYYKEMRNQVEYKEGHQPEQDVKNNVDNNFVFGKGWSYGAEIFMKKTRGKINGWIGYTWSKTDRQFAELNKGNTFPAKYDRRHDFSLVMNYEISEKWTLGAVWVYATGNAMTLPQTRFFLIGPTASAQVITNPTVYGGVYNEPGPRNSFRMASYHRLDISATWKRKKTKKFESSWNFAIFNVYNRYNPYFIYFNDSVDKDGKFKIQAKQVSLFPILPSITYNFKF
jgi:hypothetical protein